MSSCDLCPLAESRCILLPVVLRVLHAHMQEQKDLVMCARILTSMLSLIKKEENGTAVSSPQSRPLLDVFWKQGDLGGRGRLGSKVMLGYDAVLTGKSCQARGSALGQL